jgi:diaminohydroxyphosphoribosylaminopyrimidine deaminase/5-amino-6-(5-phosphoribosylamino)uracil reductase
VTEADDLRFMAAALALGRWGAGRTAPNPAVGSLIVRETPEGPVIVGAGRTGDGGRPHAERIALEQAGRAAEGATCYATLEPCSHVGRTPPCADALVAARVARVVVGTEDPNPVVAGRGISRLREAGIAVTVGIRRAEAERDMAGHISRMTRQRPHVSLKLAVSADGAIGRRGAGQVAVSGPQSAMRTHLLRAEHDAVAVGIGTVLADDPLLTCRLPGMERRSPVRVVFDTAARTPPAARLLASLAAAPLVIVAGEGADRTRVDALSEAGADIVSVPAENGRLDLRLALERLASRGILSVLVEGGAELGDTLLSADLVDAAYWIDAPRAIGGDVVPFGGRGIAALAERLAVLQRERLGEDRWTTLWRPTTG